jgi:FkbM family methyltransferase
MTKKIAFFIYKILFFFLKLLDSLFKISLSYIFKDVILENSYEHLFIKNKKIFFFIPNMFTKYRLNTFFTKEPDTINWIKKFKKNKKIIFWDIGANIGNYSIFSAVYNSKVKVFAFEPSLSNLKVLARNISINNLEEKINIIQLPLTSRENKLALMQESSFEEGGSFNSFGVNYNSDSFSKKNTVFKKLFPKNKYKIFGTSLDNLVKNKVIETPDYIKIDVDGIEHLILIGAKNLLRSKKIKSVLIELYPNFKEQYAICHKILRSCNFKFVSRTGYNYIFQKI